MWHPSAAGLAELHEEGKVTAFPAIGYEPQDESHFTSRHYWEVGQLDTNTRTGWMGRYLDIVGEPTNPLQGLSLDYSLAPALATETMPVAAVSSPADYTMWAEGLGDPVIEPALETFGALGALSAPSPAFAQARGASYDTDLVLNKMAGFVESEKTSGDKSAVTYPKGEFAERLAVAGGDAPHGHADQMRFAERRRLLRHALRRGHHARHQPRRNRRRGGRFPA